MAVGVADGVGVGVGLPVRYSCNKKPLYPIERTNGTEVFGKNSRRLSRAADKKGVPLREKQILTI